MFERSTLSLSSSFHRWLRLCWTTINCVHNWLINWLFLSVHRAVFQLYSEENRLKDIYKSIYKWGKVGRAGTTTFECHWTSLNSVKVVNDLIWFQQYFSYIMATSFNGGRSRSTRIGSPTMGKQRISIIICGCESSAPFFVNYKAGLEPTPYDLLGNPTT
jgi:hypothetical protein